MTTPEIKTFQQCLEIANKSGRKHLMLGNGFSMALFPTIFNYQQLADKISSPEIKKLFENIKTNDFEFVMYKLTETLKIIQIYDEHSELYNKIERDLISLKQSLIEVIQSSHPDNPSHITEEQYECCREFLSIFDGKKYTFNYDLLLYWVYMHFLTHLDKEKRLTCDDGFRHPENEQTIVQWEIGNEHQQDIYYLHGALHIFNDHLGIEKYTWIHSGQSISLQVRDSINNGKYPIFISEGTNEHKKARIRENSYLGRSFSSLKGITGNLFIYGHSLRDEDNHVFDVVNKHTGIKKMFISIYGDPHSSNNQKIFEKTDLWRDEYNKQIYFFNSDSANVWENIK